MPAVLPTRKNTVSTALVLSFIPLALLIALIAVVIIDLKNPVLSQETCQVLASGTAAKAYRLAQPPLYATTTNPVNDLALSCETSGLVVLNDRDAFATITQPKKQAILNRKAYQFLPDMTRLSVINHTAAEVETALKAADKPLTNRQTP